MRAIIVDSSEDGASNGGCSSVTLCIDGKVHLTISDSWIDYGHRCDYQHRETSSVCNCQKSQIVELDRRHERLAKDFLSHGIIRNNSYDSRRQKIPYCTNYQKHYEPSD